MNVIPVLPSGLFLASRLVAEMNQTPMSPSGIASASAYPRLDGVVTGLRLAYQFPMNPPFALMTERPNGRTTKPVVPRSVDTL